MGLNRTFKSKVMVVWICLGLYFLISSISIYYGFQSDIRAKNYGRLSLSGASLLNFEHPEILLWASIGHPSQKLLPIEFSHNFLFQFWAFYMLWALIGHLSQRLCPSKFTQGPFLSIFIHYGLQSNIHVKSYGCLNFSRASLLNFDCPNVFWALIRHPS